MNIYMFIILFNIYIFDSRSLTVFILGKNGTKRAFLLNCGLLSAIKQPKMVQLIRSKILNLNFFLGNIFQDLAFWFQHLNCVHCEKNGTNRLFMENCGLLSAIRQPQMVQSIRSTIQIEVLCMRNIIQHLESWFQYFNCVHFEINGAKRPFVANCGSLSAIKRPKMVQLISSQIQNYNSYVGNLFQ